MSIRTISISTIALTIAGMLTLAPVGADDCAEPGAKTNPQAAAGEGTLPSCLHKLTLTTQQNDQIQAIIREYDADIAQVMQQFTNRYMEAVRAEASLLSAIEDNLTDAQRKQVRDDRRRTAQHQKAVAGTSNRPNQSVGKAPSALEAELVIVGVSLTPEQEAKADQLQEKCLNHLRSLHRDIQGLHTRLVSLEADKLVEIEAVLTPAQLQQLRDIRQKEPIESKVAAGQARPLQSN